MIRSLTLKNFRNFGMQKFFFSEKENIFIGENGKGKTNILEAISLFSGNSINKIDFDNLVKIGENNFYLELELKSGDIFTISYIKDKKIKKYFINKKQKTKKYFIKKSFLTVSFSPLIMNIIYLSPKLRRDFLDEILLKTFTEYKKYLDNYKKILRSRNKVLKNIRENKSNISELNFWDKNYINIASIIYNYRFGISNFLFENSINFTKFFNQKIKTIEFKYKSKDITPVLGNKKDKIKNIQNQIKKQLKKNIQKDIITSKTNIGPHTDDFEIFVDNINLSEFASRGEIKSVIIGLKLLEINFIEKFTNKKPILLIDDLLSELDQKHKNLLIDNLKNYQIFITSIRKDFNKNTNIIDIKNI